jgi:hypothetical protein
MQIPMIVTENGERMALISGEHLEALRAARDYVAERASAGDEEAEDIMTALIIEERRDAPRLSPRESEQALAHARESRAA